jgi:hypothetical protein
MKNRSFAARAAILVLFASSLQGCAVAGAAGAVAGTGVKVAGTAATATVKTAGAAGRAITPGK